jgi:type VI protein secretion system component Hcp
MIGLAGMWIGEDGFINDAPLEEVRSPPISGTPPPSEEKPDEPAELIWPFTFDISKKTDLSSAALFSKFCQYKVLSKETANASNSFIPSAKLWVRKASGGDNLVYFVWEFRKLQVTAFSWMADSAGEVTESVSFRFGSCQLSYIPQAVTGGKAGQPLFSPWDLHTNTKTVEKLEDAEVLG